MIGKSEKGFYVVLEALQKAGKSTQARLLHQALAGKFADREVVLTREPGGSEIAEAIRKLVQATPFVEEMEPVCEAYLYAAARAQSLRVAVQPVVERGGIVIADRSVDTSRVIQGHIRGLRIPVIDNINFVAIQDCKPDKRYFIDVDPEICFQRAQANCDKDDKFETMPLEFFEKSREGYLGLVGKESRGMELIPGDGSVEEVHSLLLNSVLKLIDDN